MNELKKTWNGLPIYAKGLLVLGGVFAVSQIFGNAVKQNQTIDEKKFILQGKKLSYPLSTYDGFANKIYQAGFVFGGTDEDSIYDVIKKLNNDLDVLQLIKAFGNRRIEFSLQNSDLTGFLSSELSSSELAYVNSILASKKIAYRF